VGYFSSNGKISIVGMLEVDIKASSKMVCSVVARSFLSTYFFPPNISRSVAAEIGSPLESDLSMYFLQLQKGLTDLFEVFPGNT
jgi:hypothetical protein